MILTGKIDYPWAPNWYQFKDWNGNSIYVPTTACFSLIFSVLAMIKAVIHFNIARVHVGVSAIIKYLTTKSFLISNIPHFLVLITIHDVILENYEQSRDVVVVCPNLWSSSIFYGLHDFQTWLNPNFSSLFAFWIDCRNPLDNSMQPSYWISKVIIIFNNKRDIINIHKCFLDQP